MGHKEPLTIAAVLRLIQKNELILPAIQREYVWKPTQVVKVFDSIMRGYPVGSFLSWRVLPETISRFKFYGFMKDYSAFDKRHNPVVDIPSDHEVTAVLDGQQRLTSLNIGLRGTYAYRNKNGWASKEWSYPKRRLYLNLLSDAPENEAGLKYHFAFLTKGQVDAAAEDETRKWFPVVEIFDAAEPVGDDADPREIQRRGQRCRHSDGRQAMGVGAPQQEPPLLRGGRPGHRARPRHLRARELRRHRAVVLRPPAVDRHRAVEGGRASRSTRPSRLAEQDGPGIRLLTGHGAEVRACPRRCRRHRIQGEELHHGEHGDAGAELGHAERFTSGRGRAPQ